jgi:hypothetical protein
MSQPKPPGFWNNPPTEQLDSSKFPQNGLWIREFFKGLAETLNEEDWRNIYRICVRIFPAFDLVESEGITGLTEAWQRGWKLGRMLKKDWSD